MTVEDLIKVRRLRANSNPYQIGDNIHIVHGEMMVEYIDQLTDNRQHILPCVSIFSRLDVVQIGQALW